MRSALLFVALVLQAAVGCEMRPKEKPTPEQLAGRLQAALAINRTDEKDTALAALAEDAAESGSEEVTRQAVGAISRSDTKDETASHCAAKLARAGKVAAATELAKKITRTDLRDKTLKEIAAGS